MNQVACTCEHSGRYGFSESCPVPEHRATFRHLRPNGPIEIKDWVVMLKSSDMIPNANVRPGERITFRGNPMITHFRPHVLLISTNSRARLEIELRISNEIFPMGMCDTWSRLDTQLPSCFRRDIKTRQSLTPANQIGLIIENHGKFSAKIFAQVDGIFGDGQ